MELYFSCFFDHSRTDFQESHLYRVELGVGPGRAFEPVCSQRVEQHICGTVEKETELIGFKFVTRCAIGVQEGFVVHYEALHTATRTVDTILYKLSLATL
jgi:hypothetical protein